MFEKEAEEKYCKGCKSRMEQCLWAWRNTNGLNELKNCSCKEVPNYIRGAEFGYNKANEWHYVKDELPPIKENYNGRSELVLVVSEEKEMEYAQWVEKEKTWARGICEIRFKPYAWKEIELPKGLENDQKN